MCPACLRVAGGGPGGRREVLRPPSASPGGRPPPADTFPLPSAPPPPHPTPPPPPPMTSSPIPAARSQYLLDLLAQVPDPRKKRGRRHPLAGLLAVGIAAVIAGSQSVA